MNNKPKIEVIYGDLTKFSCDVVVNSANPSLLAGGGLCGALHKVAGKELESECVAIKICEVGQAKITKSYNLSKNGVGWMIHAVAPRWLGGMNNEEDMLRSAYKSVFDIVVEYESIYREQMSTILEQYFSNEELQVEIVEVDKYIAKNPIKHIAFPAMGVGIYRFPLELSARIAKEVIEGESIGYGEIEKISIVCADKHVYEVYHSIFKS